jgi:hypothetical protein
MLLGIRDQQQQLGGVEEPELSRSLIRSRSIQSQNQNHREIEFCRAPLLKLPVKLKSGIPWNGV